MRSIVAPAITTHPSTQAKCAGEDVTFSSVPMAALHQRCNGRKITVDHRNNITGATSSTLSFTTTTADNNKQYAL
jgi:hypothetical protein